jgi:hypothetical protein
MLDHRNDGAPALTPAQQRAKRRRIKHESPIANMRAVAELLGMHPDDVARAVDDGAHRHPTPGRRTQ